MFKKIKRFGFVILLTPVLCSGQKTEEYYDFYWKPCEPGMARFYSTVEKTDSGWLRHDYFINSGQLQMRALYNEKDCKTQNGYSVYYHANGQLSIAGKRVNGMREGVCVQYHYNGMMADSAFYHQDKVTGTHIRWHRNGFMADSIAIINDSTSVQISWFDNGNISAAGYWAGDQRHGKWKFYHSNGVPAGEEVYNKGRVISKNYFQQDGTPQPDTAKANAVPRFKSGGDDGWRRYLENNARWPDGYELVNTNTVTVGVSFCVDEEGKIIEVEMWVPFNPVFDDIALDIIRSSPAWKPAVRNNRKVKFWFRQPLTFQQQ